MGRKDRYESKTLTIATRNAFGRPSRKLHKLEKLVAQGWEVVSEKGGPFGAQVTTFVLRRERT